MAEEKKPKTIDAAAVVVTVPASAPSKEEPKAVEPKIKFVMMKRITDGDGPHPIHPDEVANYIKGDWVEV